MADGEHGTAAELELLLQRYEAEHGAQVVRYPDDLHLLTDRYGPARGGDSPPLR